MRMRDKNDVRYSARRLTMLAFLTALAAAVSFIESMLPSLPLAPGAKLGLANVAALFALILLGPSDAFAVMLAKCLLSAAMSGNVSSMMYSVPAGIVSLAIEVLLYETLVGKLSVTCISLVGAVAFNVVQLGVACLITGSALGVLLPWLILAGVLAGGFTGLLTLYTIKKLPDSVLPSRRTRKWTTSLPME